MASSWSIHGIHAKNKNAVQKGQLEGAEATSSAPHAANHTHTAVDLLDKVERLAVTRHQTVSSTVACLVESALRNEPESPRNSRGILDRWHKAFGPLTEEERMLVGGIIMDEPESRND